MAKRIREKALKRHEERDMRPHASVSHIRISPYKVRSVLNLVRGKSYAEACAILRYNTKSPNDIVYKLINSAAANAEHNLNISKSDLVVAEVFANQGPSLKRIRPKDHGRAHSILKRTSHITVVLDKAANAAQGEKK